MSIQRNVTRITLKTIQVIEFCEVSSLWGMLITDFRLQITDYRLQIRVERVSGFRLTATIFGEW